MNSWLGVLLLCTVGTAQTPPDDSWVVVALDTVKIQDVIPEKVIRLFQTPEFRTLDPKGEREILNGIDPRPLPPKFLKDASDLKLSGLRLIVAQPSPLQVTVQIGRAHV